MTTAQQNKLVGCISRIFTKMIIFEKGNSKGKKFTMTNKRSLLHLIKMINISASIVHIVYIIHTICAHVEQDLLTHKRSPRGLQLFVIWQLVLFFYQLWCCQVCFRLISLNIPLVSLDSLWINAPTHV